MGERFFTSMKYLLKVWESSNFHNMKRAIKPTDFLEGLRNHYQGEICHLDWDKDRPWTLLFAVILSAQCTDKRVNMVTPQLFQDFPDLEAYVVKPIEALEQAIKSTGFYRNKAKNIKKCAGQILLDHDGVVPDKMVDLVKLGGVGRKTANVILWNLFGENQGFVVDTHVGRITQRVGLTKNKTPVSIERDLMKKLPQDQWGNLSHMLVQFGRDFCKAPIPKCSQCFFEDICPKRGV